MNFETPHAIFYDVIIPKHETIVKLYLSYMFYYDVIVGVVVVAIAVKFEIRQSFKLQNVINVH